MVIIMERSYKMELRIELSAWNDLHCLASRCSKYHSMHHLGYYKLKRYNWPTCRVTKLHRAYELTLWFFFSFLFWSDTHRIDYNLRLSLLYSFSIQISNWPLTSHMLTIIYYNKKSLIQRTTFNNHNDYRS